MTNYEWLVKNDKLGRFVYDIKFLDGNDLMQEYKMKFPYENLTFERIGEWLQEEHKEPLKPCPFCGGDAEIIKTHPYIYSVKCKICKVETNGYGRIDAAEERWNRRVEK